VIIFIAMALGTTIFVLLTLIITIWVVIGVKRIRHKIFAFFLIGLILLTFFSFNAVFKDKEVDLSNVSGVITAGKIYFSWLKVVFSNFKAITASVIHMNWRSNSTEIK
jgi:hypothetical protein